MPSKSPVVSEFLVPDANRALQPLPPGVHPGARIEVRGQPWTLEQYAPHEVCGELFLHRPGDREKRVLLWPFDRPAAAARPRRWHVVRPRSIVPVLRALLGSSFCGVHLAASPRAARVLPYQLAPALEVASGCHRVLLADEVGLGKTVQAGWILADLIARQPDSRTLVAVPAGLRLQWRRELEHLFGVDAHVADARWLAHRVADLPPEVNAWRPPGIYLVSLDFLKRPDILAAVAREAWDLLIVDEAHTAAAPTDRHAALKTVALQSRTIVLISATPFTGDEAAFASLSALGSARGDEPPLMFRRSREDVGEPRTRRHRFTQVNLGADEQRFHRLLDRYTREVWSERGSADARLAMTVLRKRALSSPAAAARSLRRRQRLLAASTAPAVQLSLFDDECDPADEEPSLVLAAPGLGDVGREQRWLNRLVAGAEAVAQAGAKRAFLRRMIRRTHPEPAVIFTEFRDTLLDLASDFPEALHIHGGMTAGERARVQDSFNCNGGILLATDAAAEGLNLHHRCRLVINFELPWNPARLEQRIGRVDRIGQRQTVHAISLVARDTAEDLVIANLVRRLTRIASTLGARDRLAALLDDATTAGLVIGRETVPPFPEIEETPHVSPALPAEVVEEAARVSARGGPQHETADVLVAASRTRRSELRGAISVFDWQLLDGAGVIVAARPVAIRLPVQLDAVRSARDVRALAMALDETAGIAARKCVSHEVRQTREAAWRSHERRVERDLARERELLGEAAPPTQVQPGLFDDRTARAARDEREHANEGRERGLSRIRRLTESLEVSEVTHLRAVLLLTR